MMKKDLTTTREKLQIILNERANQLRKTAKELVKGTISIEEALTSMYQTDCFDYKDYVQGLRTSEKEEFLEEISGSISFESVFWQNFIGSIEDPTLTSLVISSPELAEICYTLPTVRFAAVLNLMPPEKVFRLFGDSELGQKDEVLRYIEKEALKNLFSCVCTFEFDEQSKFLKELDGIVELKPSSDEEVSKHEGIDESSYSDEISRKVLEAIAGLEVKEQAELIQKMPQKWIDPILAQSKTVPAMLTYLSEGDTVKIMLKCSEEHFDELFRVVAHMEVFEWAAVCDEGQLGFLERVKERKLQVGDVIDVLDLADLYCKVEDENKNFILYEILADFEQQATTKAGIYKGFEKNVRNYWDDEDVPVKDELLFLHFLVDQEQQAIFNEIFTIPKLVRIYSELADEKEKVFILNQVLTNLAEDEDIKTDGYKVFEDAIRNRFANALSTIVEDEMRFLRFLIKQNKNQEIKNIFGLDSLVRVFGDGGQEDKKYILDEILPVLDQEKTNLIDIYKDFYQWISTGEDKVKFLEMQYEEAYSNKRDAGSILAAEIMKEMLDMLPDKTTTEKLFLKSFISLIPESER